MFLFQFKKKDFVKKKWKIIENGRKSCENAERRNH